MDNGQFAEDAAAGYAEVESTEVTAITVEFGGDGGQHGGDPSLLFADGQRVSELHIDSQH